MICPLTVWSGFACSTFKPFGVFPCALRIAYHEAVQRLSILHLPGVERLHDPGDLSLQCNTQALTTVRATS